MKEDEYKKAYEELLLEKQKVEKDKAIEDLRAVLEVKGDIKEEDFIILCESCDVQTINNSRELLKVVRPRIRGIKPVMNGHSCNNLKKEKITFEKAKNINGRN